MKKIDMHFHSNRSDGNNSPYELLMNAKKKQLDMIMLTDHDRVSGEDFIEGARKLGIETMESTEISTRNYEREKSLHITCYAENISEKIRGLLEKKLDGSMEMIVAQIKKLKELGFVIDEERFFQSIERKGRERRTVNKFSLAEYVMTDVDVGEKNIKIAEKILGRNTDVVDFFLSCLKEGGEKYDIFRNEIRDYEPDIALVGKYARDDNALLSIAHPNFTFKGGLGEFERELPHYVDLGIRGIEINTMATPEWIKLIYRMKKKYGLILTIGSDNHKIGYTDEKHGDLGDVNLHICEKQIDEIYYEFKKSF